MEKNNEEQKQKVTNIDFLNCNHDYNDAKTTIRFSKKRTMVHPDVRKGVCICCQQNFLIDNQNS